MLTSPESTLDGELDYSEEWGIALDRRVKDAVPDRYAEVVKSRFRATFRSIARTYLARLGSVLSAL